MQSFLENPPDWLLPLLEDCRRDPDRYLNSTSNNIATELYGSPHQWREVKPILEEFLPPESSSDELLKEHAQKPDEEKEGGEESAQSGPVCLETDGPTGVREEDVRKVLWVLRNPDDHRGPAMVLEGYREGDTDIGRLTRSILFSLKLEAGSFPRYKPAVEEALQRMS